MPEPEEPVTEPVPSSDPTGQVFVQEDESAPSPSDSPDTPRPTALRTATVVSGRIILGFVTVGVIAAVVAAAVLIPLPTTGTKPASRVVVPTATAQELVCPGGLLRLGSTTGANASAASPLGAARITAAALGGAVHSSEFAVTDAGTAHTDGRAATTDRTGECGRLHAREAERCAVAGGRDDGVHGTRGGGMQRRIREHLAVRRFDRGRTNHPPAPRESFGRACDGQPAGIR